MKPSRRVQNTAWTPFQTPSQAHFANRTGGYSPGTDPHEAVGRKVAQRLLQYGWNENRALRADPLTRRMHMQQVADLRVLDDPELSDQVWNYATRVLGQRETRTERFDNDFHD